MAGQGFGLPRGRNTSFCCLSSLHGSASIGSTTTVRRLRTVSLPHGSLQSSHGPHVLSSHSLFVGDGVGAGEGADVGAAEGALVGLGVGLGVQSGQSFGSSSFHSTSLGQSLPPCCGSVSFLVRFTLNLGYDLLKFLANFTVLVRTFWRLSSRATLKCASGF